MNRETCLPVRRTSALRKGRISIPNARYFITCSAERPADALTNPSVSAAIGRLLVDMQSTGDLTLHAYMIMPDHIHLLFTLETRLSLSQVVRKFKAKTRSVLAGAGTSWQKNFFEHRVRPDEILNDYARYIFMNPYRAGLIGLREEWPHMFLAGPAAHDFQTMLVDGKYPPQEWLELNEKLAVGED